MRADFEDLAPHISGGSSIPQGTRRPCRSGMHRRRSLRRTARRPTQMGTPAQRSRHRVGSWQTSVEGKKCRADIAAGCRAETATFCIVVTREILRRSRRADPWPTLLTRSGIVGNAATRIRFIRRRCRSLADTRAAERTVAAAGLCDLQTAICVEDWLRCRWWRWCPGLAVLLLFFPLCL